MTKGRKTSTLVGIAFIPARAERISGASLARIVSWGIGIASAVPVLTGKVVPEVLVIAPLGAVSALVAVAIIRSWDTLQSSV